MTADAIGYWPIDKPLPLVLHDCDLMIVLGIKHARYAIRKKAGEFTFLLVRPQPSGRQTFYSGHLVRQWTRGELGESRYFQGGRRAAKSHVTQDAASNDRAKGQIGSPSVVA